MVDHLISELEKRFGSGDQEIAGQHLFAALSMLLASKETWFSAFHEDLLPSTLSLDAEITLWQRKWELQDPTTCTFALLSCVADMSNTFRLIICVFVSSNENAL